MKRGLDIAIASILIVLTAPLFLFAAAGVRLSSPGPVFYRATRVGRGGEPFEMLKFRTMHVSTDGPVISARQDARIFPVGRILRLLKIDELPQFINVLRGDMSIVGPRPEDPKIVEAAYTPWMTETLDIRPGLTSPGTIFYYARGEILIDPSDPEGSYVEKLLPAKLAVDRAYMDRATVTSDLVCILHTAVAILGAAVGRPVRPFDRDRRAAERWVPPDGFLGLG